MTTGEVEKWKHSDLLRSSPRKYLAAGSLRQGSSEKDWLTGQRRLVQEGSSEAAAVSLAQIDSTGDTAWATKNR